MQTDERVDNLQERINLVDRFNKFFEGSAEIKTTGGKLEITINHATLVIALPEVIGGHAS